MSIRRRQIERIIEDISQAKYSTGVTPRLDDILADASAFFSAFPAGNPLPVTEDFVGADGRSNVAAMNLNMVNTLLNMVLLYEESQKQVDEVMLLTSVMRDQLERLKKRRQVVSTQVDDYLLSLFNTDGYFYSIADSFGDTKQSDLSLTSAHVDLEIGAVTLPIISGLSKRVPGDLIREVTTRAVINPTPKPEAVVSNFGTKTIIPAEPIPPIPVVQGTPASTFSAGDHFTSYRVIAPFPSAVDGLTNTVWGIEVETDQVSEVLVETILQVGDINNVVELSRIDFNPHTITPVQVYVDVISNGGTGAWQNFGGRLETITAKTSFIDSAVRTSSIRIVMRKLEPDYQDNTGTSVKYRYVFGAREITMTHAIYDREATFVSGPLQISEQLSQDMVIDAVSLKADRSVPPGTDMKFYVAQDEDPIIPGAALPEHALDDFDWRLIEPVGPFIHDNASIVRYGGAQQFTRFITTTPNGPGEILRFPLDSTNTDLSQRNPSAVIIPGVDVYRLCSFDGDALLNSFILEEGVDSTRIYYTPIKEDAVKSIAWWQDLLTGPTPPQVTFGKVDQGNGFFYGGDVGASGMSIYVETYVESPDDHEPYIAEFQKSPPNAATWETRVFLNGREVGYLRTGVTKALIPWTFQKGLNHVALLINIPMSSTNVPNPYIGLIELLGGVPLSRFGTVKLATWQYADFFEMQYNQTGQPLTFTIKDGEIISRRQPATDLRLRFARATRSGPNAIRVRADLSRDTDNPSVTPRLDLYRLRFQYG